MIYANRILRAAGCLALVSGLGCQRVVNYPVPTGPRYAGRASSARLAGSRPAPDSLRLVTFNIQWGRHIRRAIEILQSAEPARVADIVTLQEVDADGVREVAEAYGMFYVYYPAVVHPKTDRDFGNAVLSRWPIVQDGKIILPHHGRFRDSERVATAATILLGDDSLRVYSVHLSTMSELPPTPRREQARTVLADAVRFPRVVIGGDMNSFEIGEEFEACGFSWPSRDNPPTIHVFTWDHIFLKGLAVEPGVRSGVVEHEVPVIDHRPVWVHASLAHSNHSALGPGDGLSPPAGCLAARPAAPPD